MTSPIAPNLSRKEHVGRAIGARILASLAFALMAALVKQASQAGANTVEIMFYRQFFTLPCVFAWVVIGPGLASMRTKRPLAHVGRALLGMVTMLLVLLAIILLPLAEATALNFVAPLFATVFAALLLGEHVGIHRWSAILIGFAGVLVITLSAGSHDVSLPGIAVGLVAAVMTALVIITVRQLSATEPPSRIVFWFALIATIFTAMPMPWYWQMHDLKGFALLIGVGVSGAMVQIMMALSLKNAPVGTTAPFDYTQLIWATALGWLIWSDLPERATIVGAILIAGSGLYTFHREHILRRRSVASADAAIS